ncbi:hypothetical protein A5N83_03920 [Rhodococcus sp. 1139]|nr:hypothetical protein A5N83_03920 [Rhodococcus sp. 1139]
MFGRSTGNILRSTTAPTRTENSMQPEGPAEQIRSTLARIAHLADTGSVEDYVEQFTRGAEWNMPANPDRGIPAHFPPPTMR